jgi:glycosyltransferase involved in cell wall biosynthesis
MRLLLVVPNIISYLVFLRELCAGLRADGVEVHIACSMAALWGAETSSAANDGVHFHPLTIPRGMNPLGHWNAARELDALVSHLRPDVVHAHFSTTIFTTALARRATWPATLGTFHGMSFPLVGGMKGRLLRAAESWTSGRMDETWVLTADDRERLRAAAPRARVEVQRSAGIGCNLDKFDSARVSPEERAALREKLGLRPEHRVFVFVGRFADFKGYDLTVRTFLQIAASDPRLRLLLVGVADPLHPTGLTPEEEAARANCPQIIDVGMQSEIAKYLAVSDAMVFPSKREGMPVCLMESLAMGVPAITRDSRGCRDVVRDGVDGFVLRDCTVANLAEAIRRIADAPDLQRQMSARALAGRARFDRGHFIREQKEIYAAWAPANPQPADDVRMESAPPQEEAIIR